MPGLGLMPEARDEFRGTFLIGEDHAFFGDHEKICGWEGEECFPLSGSGPDLKAISGKNLFAGNPEFR